MTNLARIGLAIAFVVVCYGAFSPAGASPHLFPWDKAAHFAAFFALSVFALAAFPRVSPLMIGGILSLFGAGVEVVQGLSFVTRDADVWDWVADTAAVGAALLALAAAVRRSAVSAK